MLLKGKTMSLDMLKSELQTRLKFAPPLGYVVALDLDDDGKLFLLADNSVADEYDGEADTTLTTTLADMQKIASGDLDPNMAALTGKLKIGGKMGVALKLAGYLSD